MKQYNKPTVNVVELSVREAIANLPKGVSFAENAGTYNSAPVTLTTYNLTTIANSSDGI